jgi:type IV pilus assembly protein PilF
MRLAALVCLVASVGLAACGGGTTSSRTSEPAPGSEAGRALERARIHTELGVGYYESGKLGVALQELDEAIGADKSYATAWNARALVYMDLKDDAKAERDFKQALKLDPGSSQTKNNYGLFLCQRNRGREGIRYFLDAVKDPLYETPDVAYKNAALCAQNMGDNKTAEEYFVRALKLNPRQPQSLYNMAELSVGRGRYPEAKQYLDRYMKVVPTPGPGELLLGARIERRLGSRTAMMNYGNQLRLRYPGSPETKAFLEGRF